MTRFKAYDRRLKVWFDVASIEITNRGLDLYREKDDGEVPIESDEVFYHTGKKDKEGREIINIIKHEHK